jgi:predicted dehydrogenase
VSELRFGILGAARIAPRALIEPALGIEGVRVVAIAARDPRRAEAFAKQHRLAESFPDYDGLLRSDGVDAVYVALPAALHCEWSIRALRAGKHVLCEKPIASNAAEAERIAEEAERSGRALAEACHWRYHPLAEHTRAAAGEIAPLRHLDAHLTVPFQTTDDIRFVYELGGGALMDLGCYPLQWVRFLAGSEPEVVRARAELGPPQIDIAMTADLRFAGGLGAQVRCSMQKDLPLGAQLEVLGAGGRLLVTNPLAPHLGHELRLETRGGTRTDGVKGDSTYTHQLRAFVAWVSGGAPMPTDAREGVLNMRAIDAIYRAAGLSPRGT